MGIECSVCSECKKNDEKIEINTLRTVYQYFFLLFN